MFAPDSEDNGEAKTDAYDGLDVQEGNKESQAKEFVDSHDHNNSMMTCDDLPYTQIVNHSDLCCFHGHSTEQSDVFLVLEHLDCGELVIQVFCGF